MELVAWVGEGGGIGEQVGEGVRRNGYGEAIEAVLK